MSINRTQLSRRRRRLWRLNPCCHWFCVGLTFEESTIDHVVPLSRGGGNTRENIVISCLPCNHDKGARTPEEWPGSSLRSKFAYSAPLTASLGDFWKGTDP